VIEWFGPGKAMQKEMDGVQPKLLSSLRSYASRSWSVNWPITLIMFFEFLIGLTDVYVAGRVSKEVQATYGFVIQLYFVFIVINAISVGTVSTFQRFTSGDQEKLRGLFSPPSLQRWSLVSSGNGDSLDSQDKIVNIPSELKTLAPQFTNIYALGLVFHYFLINGNGILRSCNRVQSSLKTMAVVCALNIGLNLYLVFHTPLGFRGIATATASSVMSEASESEICEKTAHGRKEVLLRLSRIVISAGLSDCFKFVANGLHGSLLDFGPSRE
jgi:Na+-driven multidrug efflux pump